MLYEIIVSGHVETYKNGYNFSACLRPHEQKSALVMLVTDFGDKFNDRLSPTSSRQESSDLT